MTDQTIKTWEDIAQRVAVDLFARLEKDAPQDLPLRAIGVEEANGQNSLDVEFVALLESRAHLTDEFLANF